MALAEMYEPLVDAAREGDTEAFDKLVRLTYGDVYNLAVRLTGNENDANDVVQDTYVRAFRGLRRFRGDANFSTWLYRIASNCASTYLTRSNRHRHSELTEVEEYAESQPDLDPELRAEASTLRRSLDWAIQELPQRLRAVVELRHDHGLSHREIAERLGITEAATKVRLHRARRSLRGLIPGAFLDEESDESMPKPITSTKSAAVDLEPDESNESNESVDSE